jgi:hypothetical protein
VLALAVLLVPASPTVAECVGQPNRWPAFDQVAHTARQVVIGRVTWVPSPRNASGLQGAAVHGDATLTLQLRMTRANAAVGAVQGAAAMSDDCGRLPAPAIYRPQHISHSQGRLLLT